MSEYELATLYRDAAAVKRYHTCRMQREQTLATHSYGVAMLVQQVFPECRKELLLAALRHDLPEYITGDVPATIKRNCAALEVLLEQLEQGTGPLYSDYELSPTESAVLKWADLMELVLWCLEEVMQGNRYAGLPAGKALEWLWKGSWVLPPHIVQTMHSIQRGATDTARRLDISFNTGALL